MTMLKKKTLFGILFGAILLSACVFPEQDDPFERLPEEPLDTIAGELFPFAVSVSTRATHRLEREGKLVGYLTSDLVRLEDFEGQAVELQGVWRTDKMREIFWVESVKVAGEAEAEDSGETRFTTKNFTFLYPSSWDYTESPDAKLFFVDKNDPNRRVFLTFAVEQFSPEAERIDPNIVLGSLAGTKEILPQEGTREKENITLYSNLGTDKYVFQANYSFDDFDKKRALLSLLESFVEGESQVATVLEGEKIKAAEAEAEKLQESAQQATLEAKAKLVDEIVDPADETFLEKLLDKSPAAAETDPVEEPTEIIVESDPVEEVQEAIKEAVTLESVQTFKNLIDARAYSYSSPAFNLSIKTPFGHWFQNFGALGGSLFAVGFADNAIGGTEDVDFWLRGKTGTPPAATTAVIQGEELVITKKRTETSLFEMRGPVQFKDAMWSVLESIEG